MYAHLFMGDIRLFKAAVERLKAGRKDWSDLRQDHVYSQREVTFVTYLCAKLPLTGLELAQRSPSLPELLGLATKEAGKCSLLAGNSWYSS